MASFLKGIIYKMITRNDQIEKINIDLTL
jgi:hypothetical protein